MASIILGFSSDQIAALGTDSIQSLSTSDIASIEMFEGSSGTASISIGKSAGRTVAHNNSIIINATGSDLNSDAISRCFIAPIRGVAGTTASLVYNTTSKEVTYNISSIKYKKNVTDLSFDTSVIYNIRAREYDTKEDDLHYIGYIAEELDAIDTHFTWKNPDGSPEGVDWFNLMIYSIEEIKKLKQEIEILKSK